MSTPRLGDPRIAVQLLTRLPVGRTRDPGGDVTAASAWFPAVGLLVAAVAIGVRAGLQPLISPVPATVAAVLAAVAVTGAFHEDGLADTADGLWGGADVERRLEIMRDSRLGTYGTVALVGDLALRMSLLGTLGLADFARAVVAAHVLGRFAPLLLSATLRPVRADGQGVRIRRLHPVGWTIATATVAAASAATLGGRSVVVLAAALVAVAGVGLLARARLGGVTGDVLGAAVRVTALAVTAAVVALAHTGVL